MEGEWLTVKQGESAESLAYARGHVVGTVWDHPDNAALKALRKDPHTLFPGDRLFVPAIRPRSEQCATAKLHRFRRREVPSRLVIVLADAKKLANLPFVLTFEGRRITGATDGEGKLSVPVMPDAGDAKLVIDPHGRNLAFAISTRHLDPITETTGIQGRLRNLGFYDGPIDGLCTQRVAFGIQGFQRAQGLESSGRLDDSTRDALLRAHGS